MFAKLQSKRIFAQAGYSTASSDGHSQKEIETGAANANACDLNWDKSKQKALDLKLTGVSAQIGQAMYTNLTVSSHISTFSPAHEAMNEPYQDARRKALNRKDVGDPRCMTTISYCSGTLAFLQSVGMEWRLIDMLDRILSTAQEHGHPDKIYQFQSKIQENAQNYWDKIVCTPICLWSGCPPTLPFMLQAITDMYDGVTDDEEKRKSLKQLYQKLSDIDSHMCVVAYHTMFKEQRKYIPSLETLQY